MNFFGVKGGVSMGIIFLYLFIGCKGKNNVLEHDPSPMHSPQEEYNTFQSVEGLQIQLIASEPMIQDPVVMTFDEDGRLWVVEMRGFMPDIDGKGELNKVGRISVLEDHDGNGTMDTSIVYIDSLILPRAIALVPNGALIVENAALWMTVDTNHDLHADTKTLIDSTYAGNLLPEHSGNGLWRGIDNWYYNAKSKLRYKSSGGKWIRDSTEFRGQWGICHDDEGRLYYNYNWSQLHADLIPPNYFGRNKNHTTTTGLDQGLTLDRRVYPIRATPAVNRGYIKGTLNDKGSLIEFTAACSPFYYRGRTFSREYYGNVFVCEPSGNLVKRNVTTQQGSSIFAHDPHPGSEFLSSSDERFRPVFIASGSDGALYITDMYRGLIQHGAYVTPYLREQTIKRKLAAPVHCGRIWKILPKGFHPNKTIKLSTLSSIDLVRYLSDSNGWYRDMAQRLLIERKDHTIQKSLTDLIVHHSSDLGRMHALWTMEGLNMLSPDLLMSLLTDSSSFIRTQAVRLLEHFAVNDDMIRSRFGSALQKNIAHANEKEALQIALSVGILNKDAALNILSSIIQTQDTSALMRDAVLSSLYHREFDFFITLMSTTWKEKHSLSKEIFLDMLTTSIIRNRNAKEISSLFANLQINDSLKWYHRTIFNAIALQGMHGKFVPISLRVTPVVLTSNHNAYDTTKLKIISNMFEWPGHLLDKSILPLYAIDEKIDSKQYALGRQYFLSSCAGCHGADGAGVNRFAPTLIGSDWVLGNEKRLSLILLHGIEGPIEVNSKVYDAPEILPVMPSHAILGDAEIAAIMTYIRNEWGNHAAPVANRVVGGTRILTQGRVMPWTAIELNKHIQDTLNKPK